MDREGRLAKFDNSRDRLLKQFRNAPKDAMSHLKAGDDYALGGLAVHVNHVLDHYRLVLDQMIAEAYGPFEVPPRENLDEVNRRCREGLQPHEVQPEIRAMEDKHAAMVAAIRSLPATDWDRKADVTYEGTDKPFATSPEDMVMWLADHYEEHVDQVGELVADWRSSRRR